jgi:formate dehydrogenase iron-sulfur subunit
MGCRACQVACKQWNGLAAERTEFFAGYGGYQNPPALSADTYTLLGYTEVRQGDEVKWLFAKRQCMHCLEPACESACPVKALSIDKETGAVTYDGTKCMGCRYCMMACPFGIPTFEWAQTIPYIRKCTFCADRTSGADIESELNGQPMSGAASDRFTASYSMPACAKTCPAGAIQFGDRDALIAEARQRMADNPGKYTGTIYGEHEAGGTSWMYIASVPFEQLGFPASERVGTRPYPEYTHAALASVPLVVIGGGAVLGGVYWLYQRRLENQQANGGDAGGPQ